MSDIPEKLRIPEIPSGATGRVPASESAEKLENMPALDRKSVEQQASDDADAEKTAASADNLAIRAEQQQKLEEEHRRKAEIASAVAAEIAPQIEAAVAAKKAEIDAKYADDLAAAQRVIDLHQNRVFADNLTEDPEELIAGRKALAKIQRKVEKDKAKIDQAAETLKESPRFISDEKTRLDARIAQVDRDRADRQHQIDQLDEVYKTAFNSANLEMTPEVVAAKKAAEAAEKKSQSQFVRDVQVASEPYTQARMTVDKAAKVLGIQSEVRATTIQQRLEAKTEELQSQSALDDLPDAPETPAPAGDDLPDAPQTPAPAEDDLPEPPLTSAPAEDDLPEPPLTSAPAPLEDLETPASTSDPIEFTPPASPERHGSRLSPINLVKGLASSIKLQFTLAGDRETGSKDKWDAAAWAFGAGSVTAIQLSGFPFGSAIEKLALNALAIGVSALGPRFLNYSENADQLSVRVGAMSAEDASRRAAERMNKHKRLNRVLLNASRGAAAASVVFGIYNLADFATGGALSTGIQEAGRSISAAVGEAAHSVSETTSGWWSAVMTKLSGGTNTAVDTASQIPGHAETAVRAVKEVVAPPIPTEAPIPAGVIESQVGSGFASINAAEHFPGFQEWPDLAPGQPTHSQMVGALIRKFWDSQHPGEVLQPASIGDSRGMLDLSTLTPEQAEILNKLISTRSAQDYLNNVGGIRTAFSQILGQTSK